MQHENRARRALILCCHCLRNLAFYRAGWKHGHIRVARQFWVNANGNFLDTSVLEWCKLFAEWDGKHHWRRVVPDRRAFVVGLCATLRITSKQFRNYAISVQRYRNKFVAHLDEEPTMYIPRMRLIRKSAAYLYDHLRNDPTTQPYLQDVRHSSAQFYAVMYRHAWGEYHDGT